MSAVCTSSPARSLDPGERAARSSSLPYSCLSSSLSLSSQRRAWETGRCEPPCPLHLTSCSPRDAVPPLPSMELVFEAPPTVLPAPGFGALFVHRIFTYPY